MSEKVQSSGNPETSNPPEQLSPQENLWMFVQRVVKEKTQIPGKTSTVARLAEILGDYKEVEFHGDSIDEMPYNDRVCTLSRSQVENLIPLANDFQIEPKDVAMLYVLPEISYWMKERGIDANEIDELEDIVTITKAKIFDSLAVCIPREYSIIGSRNSDGKSNEHTVIQSPKELAETAFKDYVANRIASNDPKYIFTPEGRSKYLQGLRGINESFSHDDWDPILGILTKIMRNPKNDEVVFQELLMASHGNDMLLTTLVHSDDESVSKARAILAIHNSGMYGIRKSWDFIPTRIKEKIVNNIGPLFDMKEKLGITDDIRATLNSILKPDLAKAKIKLGRSVYDLETDTQQKELIKSELLKNGILVDFKRLGDALDYYDNYTNQKK